MKISTIFIIKTIFFKNTINLFFKLKPTNKFIKELGKLIIINKQILTHI